MLYQWINHESVYLSGCTTPTLVLGPNAQISCGGFPVNWRGSVLMEIPLFSTAPDSTDKILSSSGTLLAFFPTTATPFPSSDIIILIFWKKKVQGDVSKGLYVFSIFRPYSMKLFCKWTKVNCMWPQLSNPPHASIDTIVLLHAQLCNLRGHYWKLASRVYSAFTVMKELLCESQPTLNWALHLKLGLHSLLCVKNIIYPLWTLSITTTLNKANFTIDQHVRGLFSDK